MKNKIEKQVEEIENYLYKIEHNKLMIISSSIARQKGKIVQILIKCGEDI